MRYETQADLLKNLCLVSQHFAAASLSLKPTRVLDTVRILTMGCILAISDTVMRMVATDVPSQLALHYSGRAEGAFYSIRSHVSVHFDASREGIVALRLCCLLSIG